MSLKNSCAAFLLVDSGLAKVKDTGHVSRPVQELSTRVAQEDLILEKMNPYFIFFIFFFKSTK